MCLNSWLNSLVGWSLYKKICFKCADLHYSQTLAFLNNVIKYLWMLNEKKKPARLLLTLTMFFKICPHLNSHSRVPSRRQTSPPWACPPLFPGVSLKEDQHTAAKSHLAAYCRMWLPIDQTVLGNKRLELSASWINSSSPQPVSPRAILMQSRVNIDLCTSQQQQSGCNGYKRV